MKKIKLYVVLFVLSVLSGNAQTYKSVLGNDTVRWSIATNTYGGRVIEWMSIPYDKATVNEKTYYTIRPYHTSFVENGQSVDFLDSIWRNYKPSAFWADKFYLRESDNFSKLFLFDKNNNKEHIVADFNLIIGDTINFKPPRYKYESNYPIVDSVYYKNGKKHIQFNAYDELNNVKLTFIESIGTNAGLFYMDWDIYTGYHDYCLQCFYSNNGSFYKSENAYYSNYSCFFDISAGIGKTEFKSFIVLKNENSLKVIFENSLKRSIAMYDTLGRFLFFKESSDTDIKIPWNIGGVYIIKVNNYSENKVEYQKIQL